MHLHHKAIVIGGGIGGLAAGIALRRGGTDVKVFECADELCEVGAGISLWANALKALDKLGLGKIVSSFSTPSVVAGLRSWQGTLLTGGSITELQDNFGELCLIMHRADLLTALLTALGPEHVHLGAQCVGFRQDAAGVTAQFAEGSSARADVLIGADGLNSTVRTQLHGQRKPTYAGYTAWRAVVRFDRQQLLPGESWGRGARFGHIPMSNGHVYWYATKNAPEGERNPGGEKAELLRIFHGGHIPIHALIEATDESAILRNDIYDRPVLRRWGEGRVSLLGDAAHPMTPNLGQGACQALEDAVVLGNCLREGPAVVSALRCYEAQRIPRTSALVHRSRQIGLIGQWQNPLAVRLRDIFMKYVSVRLQASQLERIVRYEV